MKWDLIGMIVAIQISFVCTFFWLGIIWNGIMKVKMQKNWDLQLSFQKKMYELTNPPSKFDEITKEIFNDQS
jgi:hypothetical protein